MLQQTAVSSPQTEDGGLMLPLKGADWVLPTFWASFPAALRSNAAGSAMEQHGGPFQERREWRGGGGGGELETNKMVMCWKSGT